MAKFSEWRFKVVEVPITVATDAYTAGDAVGGLLTSDEIPQVEGGGYIAWVRLVDDAKQSEGYDLWCYYETPSTIADADPYIPTEADLLKVFTVIELPAADYDSTGTGSAEAYHVRADGKDKTTGEYPMFPSLEDGKMRFYLVPGATPDYADADDLTMHIGYMLL